MEAIYRVFDISRQAVHQSSTRQRGQVHAADKLILQAQSVRKNHPRMGCRKLANRIKDESGIGRDKVEALLQHEVSALSAKSIMSAPHIVNARCIFQI